MFRPEPLFILILVIFVIIAIAISLVWYKLHTSVFYPTREVGETFMEYKYDDIYLRIGEISDGPVEWYPFYKKPKNIPCINVWHFKFEGGKNSRINKSKNKGIIMYLHGTTGNISHRRYVIDFCYHFGIDLLLIDYRGYGRSDGVPSMQGFCDDALTAYSYLLNFYGPNEITIWGESLGGAAAIYTAANRDCRSLILLSTFSGIDNIIKDSNMLPMGGGLLSSVGDSVSSMIKTRKWIGDVKCPIAILHSKTDEFIPFKNAERLFKAITHDNKIFIIIEGSHPSPIITEDDVYKLFEFAGIDVVGISLDGLGITENFKNAAEECGISATIKVGKLFFI